jgi:hypothetical protein
MNCIGVTREGLPCKGQAQKGYVTCPSHRLSVEGVLPRIRFCVSVTKSGTPCRAGAAAGHPTCQQHEGTVRLTTALDLVRFDLDWS